ncbi:MAG: hypothetical protein V1667_00880 [bacterium]
MNQKTFFSMIAVAAIFFGLGFYFDRAPVAVKKGDNTFQAGWQAAKDRLKQSSFMPMMNENMEISSVSGEVKEVQDNQISIKINPLEPLADPELDNRIIELDNNTKIYQLSQKDQAQYQKESEDFEQKMKQQMEKMVKPEEMPAVSANPITPPDMFVKKEIKAQDIAIGSQANVIAVEKDIKNAKKFIAAEITIQPSAPMAMPATETVTPPASQ